MILFVGYDQADMESVSPVRSALLSAGYQSEVIGKGSFVPDSEWEKALPTFPLRDPLLGSSASLELEYRALLGRISESSVLKADKLLDHRQPAALVLCPGHWESTVMREAARRRKMPRLFFLPTFYELKETQPFHIFQPEPTERFVCAGPCGRERYIAAGAHPEAILVTGSPAFDRYAGMADAIVTAKSDGPLLCALQCTSEDESLLRAVHAALPLLNRAVRVRPHPATSANEHGRLRSVLPESSHVVWSESREVLDDLKEAAIVLAHSSTLLVTAAVLGRRAIVWNPTYLPSELSPKITANFKVACSFTQLLETVEASCPPTAQISARVRELAGVQLGAAERVAQCAIELTKGLATD
ncbi:MAG: hypothetical protein U0136_12920 [Bdellovibrionota bacterium]